ncbi:MAG: hypothetical protein C0511_18985, partial [Hyphomicrobium sp.]|nr:hypothetical protein [Hyphomicrobium sp.]
WGGGNWRCTEVQRQFASAFPTARQTVREERVATPFAAGETFLDFVDDAAADDEQGLFDFQINNHVIHSAGW